MVDGTCIKTIPDDAYEFMVWPVSFIMLLGPLKADQMLPGLSLVVPVKTPDLQLHIRMVSTSIRDGSEHSNTTTKYSLSAFCREKEMGIVTTSAIQELH